MYTASIGQRQGKPAKISTLLEEISLNSIRKVLPDRVIKEGCQAIDYTYRERILTPIVTIATIEALLLAWHIWIVRYTGYTMCVLVRCIDPRCRSTLGSRMKLMNRNVFFIVLLGGLFAAAATTAQAEAWPGWRGPRSDGACIEKNIPTNWDPAGALWKIELPGKGHASPIVWGDRVCTVTSMAATKERILLCIERTSGKILWRETVVQGPLEKLHKENSYASSTPVTDGSRVFVTFRVGDDILVAAHDLVTGDQRRTSLLARLQTPILHRQAT